MQAVVVCSPSPFSTRLIDVVAVEMAQEKRQVAVIAAVETTGSEYAAAWVS